MTLQDEIDRRAESMAKADLDARLDVIVGAVAIAMMRPPSHWSRKCACACRVTWLEAAIRHYTTPGTGASGDTAHNDLLATATAHYADQIAKGLLDGGDES